MKSYFRRSLSQMVARWASTPPSRAQALADYLRSWDAAWLDARDADFRDAVWATYAAATLGRSDAEVVPVVAALQLLLTEAEP